jgi:IMP dehydrogenase
MKRVLVITLALSAHLQANVQFVQEGLSYDDVLLVPQRSSVTSRKQVSTRTRFSRRIELAIPIVSSNMDTVTGSDMAIAMAELGGLGIIHRFNTIPEQVAEVQKVKRHRNTIIRNPLTISHDASIAQARDIMQQHEINGLLVIDQNHILVGIITSRDIRFRSDETLFVRDCMTSRNQLIVGNADISIEQAKDLLTNHRIEKLPLINADGTIAGLITSKDISVTTEYPLASVDKHGCLLVGAAIGVKDDTLERAAALVEAGVDVLVLDIAHGHSEIAINMIKEVKAAFPHIDIVAGNVATAQGTYELIQAGADAIKVGVGPGSICTTRIVTGSGYPQLSAIINCAQEADKYGIPVIADGGIRYSGDITKAIAAGASTVMLGNLLAGTDESPGMPLVKNGKRYKVVRGMASFGANLARNNKNKNARNIADFVPEGVEGLTPYKGSVVECIYQLLGGLHSGMSYCGVTTIEQLRGNGVFVKITSSGMRESHAHDVEQIG